MLNMVVKNKTLIIVVSFVLLLIVGFIVFSQFLSQPSQNSSETSDLTNALLANATVTVPQLDPVTSVKLTGQTTSFSPFTDESDSAVGTITLVGTAVGDDQTIFAVIAVNAGGSGTFFYLTAFENTPNGYVSKAYEPMGDRVQFQNISFEPQNSVTVSYLTHGPTQSMADSPNQKVTQTFTYTKGAFSATSGS